MINAKFELKDGHGKSRKILEISWTMCFALSVGTLRKVRVDRTSLKGSEDSFKVEHSSHQIVYTVLNWNRIMRW